MIRKIATAAAATMMVSAGAASAQIVDGGFETQGAASTASYCYFTLPNGDGPCQATTWSGTGGLQIETNGAWPGVSSPDGQYYGFIQGTGTLTQTFNAGAGAYMLNWLAAGRPSYGGSQNYSVLVDGNAVYTGTAALGSPFTAAASSSFVLGAGSHTVTFQGLSTTGDNTAFIDAVAIQAVPEPESWALLIGGLGIVGMTVRRRRREGTLATA